MRVARTNQSGQRSIRRRGAAVVELAVVSPLLIFMVLGVVEFGWTMMVRQSMVNAVREGARAASLKYTSVGAQEAAIIQKIDEALSPLGLTFAEGDYTLEMTHAADPPVFPNDVETATISVPYSGVSLLGGFFDLPDLQIRAKSSMRKEL